MPILSGTVTFARFRVEPAEAFPTDVRRWLSRGLRARAFEPIDRRTEEERAAGFVELEDHEATEFSPGRLFYGEYALLAWRIDTLKVRAAVLKAELAQWAAAFEKEQGRAPAKREKAERRSALRQAMRSQAVPVTKVYDVSWNLKAQQLQLWASSRKVVDEVTLAMESCFRIRLHAQVPSVVARRQGVADAALGPTPELLGIELSGKQAAALESSGPQGKEVSRGKA
jgi:recombination associated protein RdgC